MKTYLFIVGKRDGLTIPHQPDQDTVHLPASITSKETYIHETLTDGDVLIASYRHESMTSEQFLIDWLCITGLGV